MQRLVPRARDLARRAATYGIQLTIDAEEADRLDLSLDVIEALAGDSATREWPGLGLAVQAYSKRALDVIEWVAAIARSNGRRVAVRLVKGAYWDSEIKRGQERGLEGYPVYTRKVTTDVSYLACAGRLFQHADVILPQFATHNAHSIASILELAPAGAVYEFQRLHGMGRLLYAEAARQVAGFPQVRVYAPVGEHKDLLAYLVRRLLENGANTSFVNRFMDEQVPVAEIVRDPISELERLDAYPHPRLPNPVALYAERRNSGGVDTGNPQVLEALRSGIASRRSSEHVAGPIINGDIGVGQPRTRSPIRRTAATKSAIRATRRRPKLSPRSRPRAARNARGTIGAVRRARIASIGPRICSSKPASISTTCWCAKPARPCRMRSPRCARPWTSAATMPCAHAVDFANATRLEGPTGELNELSLHGRGVFACISPWNFPLAIFAGQVTAALAAGNGVVAKPAEPTPVDRRALRAAAARGGRPA